VAFETNVFINCPFDKEFKPILKSIIFCVVYLEYTPHLSETTNSAESRIDGIQKLIKKSKYSIHDLSRMKSSKKNELSRFNMPFELGMDLGSKRFGNKNLNSKCLLILDQERYRYQQSISDISGNDIATHSNSPEKALRQIRNWFRKLGDNQIESANKIWRLYNEFIGDFFQIATDDELSIDDIEEMPWDEFTYYIRQWVDGRKNFDPKSH
jgi:hypothetical protein